MYWENDISGLIGVQRLGLETKLGYISKGFVCLDMKFRLYFEDTEEHRSWFEHKNDIVLVHYGCYNRIP